MVGVRGGGHHGVMARANPTSSLYQALEKFGRQARQLSVARMLSVDFVLRELADEGTLADATKREQFARDIVVTLGSLVEEMNDPVNRRIAEAVLAVKAEFFDKTVDERKDYVRDNDRGFSDDQYKARRAKVIADLEQGLLKAFRNENPVLRKVFIAGSYRDPVWDRDAAELGIILAGMPVIVVSGSEMPGRRISYAMAEALEAKGIYAPDRIRLFARTDPNKPTLADRPLGTITYFGTTKTEKRREMIRISEAALLFGGRDGTIIEAQMAEAAGIPVIPLAFTEGAAKQYWLAHKPSSTTPLVGGKPIEPATFELLHHSLHSIALQAAATLLRQALALPAN
ncbi:hypothetical protein [Nocardia brasiliensis]|uniref:hypothetical protein n=1 Tax=Nocardia brasiliensis TaxID=37326 RepID=UPI00245567E7|nr:hypothetical protein [Nocardia brasiliensis]